MKQCLTLLSASAVLLLSCSQDKDDLGDSFNALGVSDEIYVSEWEQHASWDRMDSANFTIHYTNRAIPQLTQDAVTRATVLTYSKIHTSHPDYARFANPIRLDYYFLPPNAKPVEGHFHWYDVHRPGNIRLSFSVLKNTPLPDGISLNQFWFRHVVIPPHILQSMGLTPDKIKYEYSYEQLMDLLGRKR